MITTAPVRRVMQQPGDDACVRVLTYHRFSNEHRDPFSVTPEDFDRQMALLASEGRAVSLQQVIDFLRDDAALPAHACLVTIDDGMLSTLSTAVPILEKHGVPGVAYVSSKLVGLDQADLPERYLTSDELRTLNKCKQITIGSHAHTHRSMAELPREVMRDEAETSKRLLSDIIDEEVNSFAYPFGMQKDFDSETDRTLCEAGYEIAFNSMHGAVRAGMPRHSLPRVKVEGGESLSMFAAISRGAMDDWRLVDDRLWRAQRVRREIA